MTEASTKHREAAIAQYTPRAETYEEANGGWHIKLGRDFVNWLSPIRSSSIALDLACGTGLVTIPLAKAIGSNGQVIGVDLTATMLNVARRKPVEPDAAPITWIEHDITQLDEVEEVQDVVRTYGGFDYITCCSALVLLPDVNATVKMWVRLLQPGGRLVVDVPTEEKTLQFIMTEDMRRAAGLNVDFDRSWIESIESLEKVYAQAGLVVERSWRHGSTVVESVYENGDLEEVFEEQLDRYKDFKQQGLVEKIREPFREMWLKQLKEDGRFHDGHWLYVAVGRKP